MKKKKILSLSTICFIVAFFAAVTFVASIYSGPVTTFLCPPIINTSELEATTTEGEELAEQIMGEGAVLVKNNGVLPLSKFDVTTVNIFGWGSSPHGWVAGGSGSGRVMSVENDDHYAETNITKAFTDYGIQNNDALTSMYTRYASVRPAISSGTLNASISDFYRIVEPSVNDTSFYTASLKADAETFSDTAFVVISRIAGEAKDPPRVQYKQQSNGTITTDSTRTYLEISTEEEALLDYVASTFENVIVIINSTNTMELGFVETIDGIDACLIVGGTGINAATAIPKIIYGDINPSGRVVDTYAYELESNINFYNAGDAGEGTYTNSSGMLLVGSNQNAGTSARHGASYIDYVENIYVGYKWYETADAMGYWDDSSTLYGEGYDGVVQYPFGYGLSYISPDDFAWDVQDVYPAAGSVLKATDEITITVRVTNNSSHVMGKDVVQLYFTAPYTTNGIEKASVNLCAFGKTLEDIQPGESQVVVLSFKVEDMASYDCYDKNNNGFCGYELERGEYEIKLMTDSHNIKTVNFDGGSSNVAGIIRYTVESNIRYETDSVTGELVYNKFTGTDALDGVSIDGEDEATIQFVSRSNFPDVLLKEPDRAISAAALALNRYTQAMATSWDNATTDILGNEISVTAVSNKTASSGTDKICVEVNGNTVTELGLSLGSDYNSTAWDSLLDQVAIATMKSFVSSGDLYTTSNAAINLPAIQNLDGPSQIGGFSSVRYRTVGYPTATVIAQTFNTQLALSFGSALGQEGVSKGVKGWLGPGVNIHRTPFGGRNYEYYSEDSYLTGMMCSYAIIGAKNAGAYCYLKHLVLYEQESNRESLYTWLTEQALREIYLKPFKMAVQIGGATGIMSSYGRVGAVWAGGSEALITGVVRTEWGFCGAVITDWSDNKVYMNMDQALRAGGNRFMGSNGWLYGTTSDRFEQQVRTSYKQVVYMLLNSYYQNENPVIATEKITVAEVTPSFVWWVPMLVVVDVLVVGGCGVWGYFVLRKKPKPSEEPPQKENDDTQ